MEPRYHPSFPQPADLTVSIWRYMDSPKFEWLLNRGRLYMPTADQLGDDLEGSTPQGEIDWWNDQIAKAETREQRATLRHNRSFFARMSKAMRKIYFVSCWHMNPHENNVMWGTYTSSASHEAVAIRTTFADLQGNLPSFVYVGLVRYLDYATSALPDRRNAFEWIMHKEAYFSGEVEVRAVTFPPASDESGKAEFHLHLFRKDDDGSHVYAPPVNLARIVRQVVVHPLAGAEFNARITALCQAHGLPAPTKSRRKRQPVY